MDSSCLKGRLVTLGHAAPALWGAAKLFVERAASAARAHLEDGQADHDEDSDDEPSERPRVDDVAVTL